ncbi:MAG: hypothetical protein IIX28_02700 [Clostridia bacterium]|nr:hypothetical protein [Clostridia bacterium]
MSIFDDFFSIWLGPEFVLDKFFLISLVINTTVSCISNPLWMTREASGVFKSVRYVMLSAAILNIIFSVVLAQFLGLAGIILATGIARLLTLFWYEPHMLCKNVFCVPTSLYWKYVCRLCLAIVPCGVIGWILHEFSTENIFFMVGKVVLCGITTLISFFALFRKSEELQWIIDIILTLLKKKSA